MGWLDNIKHFLSVTTCDVTELLTGQNVQWGVCDIGQGQIAETYDPCHPVYGDPTSEECTGIPDEGLWGLEKEVKVAGAIVLGLLAYSVLSK